MIAYAFMCAGLYQMAYWSTFKLNAFSFIGFSDIVSTFIQPIVYGPFVAMMIYMTILEADSKSPVSKNDFQPSERSKKINSLIIRFIKLFYLVIISWQLVANESIEKAVWLPILFIPVAVTIVMKIEELYKPEFLGWNIFFTLYIAVLPMVSITQGRVNALDIYYNSEFQYIQKNKEHDALKFIGKAGDLYIFSNTANTQVSIIPGSSENILTLINYKGHFKWENHLIHF